MKLAFVPVPSVDPIVLDKLPAKVVTTPADVILRIRLLPRSATYKLPTESNATPAGLQKLALVPVPSADPCVLPAKVVTTPA